MFIVEGNIGVGKSTFLSLMAKHDPSIIPLFEPLHQWQSQDAQTSLLGAFYTDPHRWAFMMETVTMASRIHDHIIAQENQVNTYQKNNQILLAERSIYSGNYCFAYNDYIAGFLTDVEWHVYCQWFELLITQCKEPQGFIYLQVDPAISHQRMSLRNRTNESSVPLAYLQAIHDRHEEFLIEKKRLPSKLKEVPTLVLDCNVDFEKNTDYFQELAQQVIQFTRK